MATQRQFRCSHCDHVSEPWKMLDALTRVANRTTPVCPECNLPLRLHLSFDFALGGDGRDVVVAASYLPRPTPTWRSGESDIVFLPFLVVTETPAGRRAMWLPYWHTVTTDGRGKMKYGQWAPYMDNVLFLDLLAQARADGFLGELGA